MRFYYVGLAPDASEFSIRWFYGRKFNKKLSFHANFLDFFFAFNAKLYNWSLLCAHTERLSHAPKEHWQKIMGIILKKLLIFFAIRFVLITFATTTYIILL